MNTKNPVPNFKYSSKDPASKNFGVIEIDDAVKFWIDNLDNFYQAFGYNNELKKWGVFPNQFIWEEYLSNAAKSHLCFQLHTIEYLMKYSAPFLKMYGDQCDDWIAALAEARSLNGEECRTCIATRNEKYCQK
jgi:hypothetical protein